MDRMVMWQVVLPVFRVSPVSIIPSMCHTSNCIHPPPTP